MSLNDNSFPKNNFSKKTFFKSLHSLLIKVNDFSSGADMRRESDGTAVQSDYIGIFLTETETGGPGTTPSGIYTVTLQAQSGDGTPATAEVMYQFEFLVYSEVIPTIS